ncbi:zinc finger protein 85-like [Tigriopus californicus]|nr:zinc finger protein 85-like [Tigriopus californicus]
MNFGNLVKHVAEHHPDKIEEYSRFGQHDDEELEQDMKQPLKCIKCDMVFNGNVLLHRHKQIYHEMGDYNCEECQKPCLTYYDLTVHNYEEHAKPIRYLKPYNYGLESITLDDGKIEKKRTLFVCEHCQASFNTDPGWTLHLRIQHSWGLFECKPCEEVCHYAKDMSAHVLNFHKDQPEVKCPSCPEVFCLRDDPDKFLNHYRDCSRVEAETKSKQKVEERKSENYQCDYCGKNYNSKLAFEAHILKQHQGIERYKCDQCDFGTNLKDVLKGHEKIHLRKKGLTNADTDLVLFHQCDQCGKQFSHMTTLRRHIQRVHEGIKPQYKCSDCEFFAYSNSMLYKHKREVHGFVNIFKKNGRIHSKLKE